MRLGILTSHPIQYQSPWFRELSKLCDLQVYFAHRPDQREQGEGFGNAFEWDVDLLSGYESQFLENVSKQPSTSRFRGCDTPSIAAEIAGGGFDAFVVTGWNLMCHWQAVKACRKRGIPVLVRGDSQLTTPRSFITKLLKKIIYRRMLKFFDGFLTVGQRNREYLLHYGVPEESLFPAPHFVDNEWFAKEADLAATVAQRLRADWKAGDEDLVVMFVGKFIDKKRPVDLVEVLPKLNPSSRAICVLVGSGELENKLHARCRAVRVAPIFAGFQNQSSLPAYYSAADVLVLPSDGGETWGLVVNEAMACGTPAVVSEACGCVPDLIDEGQSGFTFPVGDLDALEQRLNEMARLKQARQDWKQALARKISQFTAEKCARGTVHAAMRISKSE